jgi:hypothetical protein
MELGQSSYGSSAGIVAHNLAACPERKYPQTAQIPLDQGPQFHGQPDLIKGNFHETQEPSPS